MFSQPWTGTARTSRASWGSGSAKNGEGKPREKTGEFGGKQRERDGNAMGMLRGARGVGGVRKGMAGSGRGTPGMVRGERRGIVRGKIRNCEGENTGIVRGKIGIVRGKIQGIVRGKKREGEKSRGTYSPCVSNHFPFLFDFYIAGLKAFE